MSINLQNLDYTSFFKHNKKTPRNNKLIIKIKNTMLKDMNTKKSKNEQNMCKLHI